MKRKINAGTTSLMLPCFVQDTSSTTGAGLAVTHASSGLVFEYRRHNESSWTSVTPVSATLGSYTSGGVVADGALTGAIEVGIPDAALASGARAVYVRLRGVSNMFAVLIEIELDAVYYKDAAGFGLSRIDQTIGSRMATYTQPNGFLAATFPTTVASPTNITSASGVAVSSLGSNVITSASIAASALDSKGNWNVGKTGYALTAGTGLGNQTANITGNLSGSVGSVTGAVGSVTGAVGSVTGLTTSTIATAVWSEAIPGSFTSGTAGAALNSAGSAGDPWSTALPGSYGAGTAGNIIGNRIDAAITSRMATYTQPTGFLASTFPSTVASPTNITAATGVVLATAPPTASAIASAVWSESIPGSYTSGQAGGKLNSAGSAGDPWSTALPGAYSAGSAGHIIGNRINAAIDSRMASYTQPAGFLAATFPATVASQSTLEDAHDFAVDAASASATAAAVAVKLDTMLQASGSNWQFTIDAVENSPAGEGGPGGDPWATEITVGSYTGNEAGALLLDIRSKTVLISSDPIVSSSPVSASGQIAVPIIIGDAYLAENGRAFAWDISPVTGFTVGGSSCRFGGKYKDSEWLVTGTVTDNGNGTWKLSFDLTEADTIALEAGIYDWSVEIRSTNTKRVTKVRSGKAVQVVEKQTPAI